MLTTSVGAFRKMIMHFFITPMYLLGGMFWCASLRLTSRLLKTFYFDDRSYLPLAYVL